ncbi:hypothetical protein KM043_010208 [Ampulex compressa]|nr:hypothetical protein KM043_010208 [Ampulex compressa]
MKSSERGSGENSEESVGRDEKRRRSAKDNAGSWEGERDVTREDWSKRKAVMGSKRIRNNGISRVFWKMEVNVAQRKGKRSFPNFQRRSWE